MKTFACDNCKEQFGGPLDEEHYTDEHGVVHTFDLCAPCRQKLKVARQEAHKQFFDKILKEK